MKKRKVSLSLLLMLFLTTVLATAFVAHEDTNGLAAPSEIIGSIKRVSVNFRLLAIETPEQSEMTISIETDTKITVDGKAGRLQDLKEGQRIKATLRDDSSKALTIEVN
jgi:hypothetical protein